MALHCKRHGRSIVPNRSEPEATATGKTNSRKPKDASAGASCRAIRDDRSTRVKARADSYSVWSVIAMTTGADASRPLIKLIFCNGLRSLGSTLKYRI